MEAVGEPVAAARNKKLGITGKKGGVSDVMSSSLAARQAPNIVQQGMQCEGAGSRWM